MHILISSNGGLYSTTTDLATDKLIEMKFGFLHIIKVMSIVTVTLLLLSCSKDNTEDRDIDEDANDNLYRLALHISPVGTRAGSGNNVREMIQSLRIIMVNEDSVEFNKLITLEIPGGILATDFKYDFLHRTPKGTKKFYYIANEDYVGSPSFDATLLPDGITSQSSFTDILNAYEAGYSDLTDLDGFLQSVSFDPKYSITDEGNIYLPYTSIYENLVVGDKDFVETDMYLVPVAAKFYFNFTNYRSAPIKVNEISIAFANTTNFMFARVGKNDYLKKLPGESTGIYWVDWLAKVSSKSWDNSDYNSNMGFNNTYGWISDYEIPSPSDTYEPIFVAEAESFTIKEIDINEEDETDPGTPGKKSVGPFYVPESKNFVNPNQTGSSTEQAYFMTIAFEDLGEGKVAPPFENNGINNLNALFRNTCVIINIILDQGQVMAYAEIAPWNVKSANGFVTEGEKPDL